jgi:hypothetical protein
VPLFAVFDRSLRADTEPWQAPRIRARWVLLIVVLVLVAAGAGLYAYASSDYTACYSQFDSRQAADQAAEAGGDAGFDTDVEERRPGAVFVTFTTGEADSDAVVEYEDSFQRIVKDSGGTLAHPGTGCIPRQVFGG